jgi:hypothetical protein
MRREEGIEGVGGRKCRPRPCLAQQRLRDRVERISKGRKEHEEQTNKPSNPRIKHTHAHCRNIALF